ncbi:hypothetical protein ACIPK7_05430 [Pseudomonas sp. NPDC086581]|uniref:hypothetical protein n=1 Tax=Pseudomonas sp. NPDC086581 TaxID=3364432 RepID=UPI003800EFE6
MCTKPNCDAVIVFALGNGLGDLAVRCGWLDPEQRLNFGCDVKSPRDAIVRARFAPPRITKQALESVRKSLGGVATDVRELGFDFWRHSLDYSPIAQALLDRVIGRLDEHGLWDE